MKYIFTFTILSLFSFGVDAKTPKEQCRSIKIENLALEYYKDPQPTVQLSNLSGISNSVLLSILAPMYNADLSAEEYKQKVVENCLRVYEEYSKYKKSDIKDYNEKALVQIPIKSGLLPVEDVNPPQCSIKDSFRQIFTPRDKECSDIFPPLNTGALSDNESMGALTLVAQNFGASEGIFLGYLSQQAKGEVTHNRCSECILGRSKYSKEPSKKLDEIKDSFKDKLIQNIIIEKSKDKLKEYVAFKERVAFYQDKVFPDKLDSVGNQLCAKEFNQMIQKNKCNIPAAKMSLMLSKGFDLLGIKGINEKASSAVDFNKRISKNEIEVSDGTMRGTCAIDTSSYHSVAESERKKFRDNNQGRVQVTQELLNTLVNADGELWSPIGSYCNDTTSFAKSPLELLVAIGAESLEGDMEESCSLQREKTVFDVIMCRDFVDPMTGESSNLASQEEKKALYADRSYRERVLFFEKYLQQKLSILLEGNSKMLINLENKTNFCQMIENQKREGNKEIDVAAAIRSESSKEGFSQSVKNYEKEFCPQYFSSLEADICLFKNKKDDLRGIDIPEEIFDKAYTKTRDDILDESKRKEKKLNRVLMSTLSCELQTQMNVYNKLYEPRFNYLKSANEISKDKENSLHKLVEYEGQACQDDFVEYSRVSVVRNITSPVNEKSYNDEGLSIGKQNTIEAAASSTGTNNSTGANFTSAARKDRGENTSSNKKSLEKDKNKGKDKAESNISFSKTETLQNANKDFNFFNSSNPTDSSMVFAKSPFIPSYEPSSGRYPASVSKNKETEMIKEVEKLVKAGDITATEKNKIVSDIENKNLPKSDIVSMLEKLIEKSDAQNSELKKRILELEGKVKSNSDISVQTKTGEVKLNDKNASKLFDSKEFSYAPEQNKFIANDIAQGFSTIQPSFSTQSQTQDFSEPPSFSQYNDTRQKEISTKFSDVNLESSNINSLYLEKVGVNKTQWSDQDVSGYVEFIKEKANVGLIVTFDDFGKPSAIKVPWQDEPVSIEKIENEKLREEIMKISQESAVDMESNSYALYSMSTFGLSLNDFIKKSEKEETTYRNLLATIQDIKSE